MTLRFLDMEILFPVPGFDKFGAAPGQEIIPYAVPVDIPVDLVLGDVVFAIFEVIGKQ